MDLAAARSWASQPDVCRCCLSASGTFDLTASYVNDGVKEVFSDMVLQCYGIKLSRLTEWGPSRLICKLCAMHLRMACTFRKQVTEAEACFAQYYAEKEKGGQDSEVTIKSENVDDADYFSNNLPLAEEDLVPECNADKECLPTVEIKSETEQRSKRRKQKTTKRANKKHKLQRDATNDSEATNPEVGITTDENNPFAVRNKTDMVIDSKIENLTDEKFIEKERDKTDIPLDYAQKKVAKPKPAEKQISERKRVMLTCYTVLKYTSACPFRHYKSWFQCFYCLQEFMEINMLRHHISRTHLSVEDELKRVKRFPRSLQIDISDLRCLECSLTLNSVDSMKDHFLQKHDEVIYKECIADYKVDASPFKCHLCRQEFHVFRSLTVHLNDHYANCICDVCGKSFLNSKRLKVHKRTHESGLFPCTECDKVLKTKTSKANHMENSHSKRVLKCHICLKPMKHYNDRIKHMSEAHHVTHTFKCPMCPKEYNIKHYLATHVRQTHGSKNKKCSECNMAFITNHGLKKHMLKHTGEKPFTCNVCGKAYARSYTLKEHMRVHDGDGRGICTEQV